MASVGMLVLASLVVACVASNTAPQTVKEEVEEPFLEVTSQKPYLNPTTTEGPYPECISAADPAGVDYRGTMGVTEDLIPCQSWDSPTPHKHNFHQLSGEGNYCRNRPIEGTEEMQRPWCYTSDPKVRWQYCDIPTCANP